MPRTYKLATALLCAWALLLLHTHRGPWSPYTYIAQMSGKVDRLANPDALTVVGVTRFFYEGVEPLWKYAHNLKLPLHSFAVATVGSFVRPYLLANDLTNYLFVVLLIVSAMRLAARRGVSATAMLLGLGTVLTLPSFVAYLGQPMHYIVGPVVSYLVMLTAIALPEKDLRNPWIAGAATAILTLNYDWYVFGAALAIYVLAVLRFERGRDYALYAFAALAPVAIWNLILDAVSGGAISTAIRDQFFAAVLHGWMTILRDPMTYAVTPFIVTHVGVHVALHQVLALVYWPLLLVGVVMVWRDRPAAHRLFLLLIALFFVEQVLTAAFDWENSPRRALPVLFVFGCAYCLAVDRRLASRRWVAAFTILLVLTAFLAFSDVLFGRLGTGYLHMGDAIRNEPKEALQYATAKLRIAPSLDPNQWHLLGSLPAARIRRVAPFLAAQVFVGFWFFVLFTLLRRAGLMPRFAAATFLAVWLLSAVRFV